MFLACYLTLKGPFFPFMIPWVIGSIDLMYVRTVPPTCRLKGKKDRSTTTWKRSYVSFPPILPGLDRRVEERVQRGHKKWFPQWQRLKEKRKKGKYVNIGEVHCVQDIIPQFSSCSFPFFLEFHSELPRAVTPDIQRVSQVWVLFWDLSKEDIRIWD